MTLGLLAGIPVHLHDPADAARLRRIDEDAHDIRMIAQNMISGAAHDHAAAVFGDTFDHPAPGGNGMLDYRGAEMEIVQNMGAF